MIDAVQYLDADICEEVPRETGRIGCQGTRNEYNIYQALGMLLYMWHFCVCIHVLPMCMEALGTL